MATKVFMEALSPTMEEGKLLSWHKQEGDRVTDGDVLAEVETDKAVMELQARGAGAHAGPHARRGLGAAGGELVAVLREEGLDVKVESPLVLAPG